MSELASDLKHESVSATVPPALALSFRWALYYIILVRVAGLDTCNNEVSQSGRYISSRSPALLCQDGQVWGALSVCDVKTFLKFENHLR